MNTSEHEQKGNSDTHEALTNWQDQKFSMFIHCGLYSIPAGMWDGQKITGYSEQIKGHAKISTEEYHKLAAEFHPTEWSADSVALLAKKAGMKSIIITSKHHDGFCMFASKYTQFDVVDATPYKRDVVKELAGACKRNGLKFGVYYSLIDWDYHDALPFISTQNSDSIPPLHHQYNLNQIQELLTNYGEISELWLDMGAPSYEQSKEMAMLVKKIQPNCLISSRIWNDQGDFIVMGDNYQPEFKMGVPWQTPASMFPETWGYRSWQERPDVKEKIHEKILDLLNIVSSGGNYLLNIGPKGDGTIIPFEKQVLEGLGQWLKRNGESIYGTKESPFPKQDWGVSTLKPGKLYLHLINFPENRKLTIKGLNADIIKVHPLCDVGVSLNSTISKIGCEIDLPEEIVKDKYVTVLVLEYKKELLYTPANVLRPNEDGEFILTLDNCEPYHSYSGHDYYSTKPTIVKMKWYLLNSSTEPFEIRIALSAHENNNGFKFSVNNEVHILPVENSEINSKNNVFKQVIQGLRLKSEGINEIELSLKDRSNPHRGMSIDSLGISIIQATN